MKPPMSNLPATVPHLTTRQAHPRNLPPDTEVLQYIGEHMTENYVGFGNWRRLVYHLFRSAAEQRGLEFTERVKLMLLRGNSDKRGNVLEIFRQATAAVRNHNQHLVEYDEPDDYEPDGDEEDAA